MIICFWPVLAFIAPELLAGTKAPPEFELPKAHKSVFRDLQTLSPEETSSLSAEELSRVIRVSKEGESGTTYFADSASFDDVLDQFWDDDVPPAAYYPLRSAKWRLSEDYGRDDGIRFSRRTPDWYIGFSEEFVKSIAKIDKTKRARLLEAIGKIAAAPITPYGDTVKPLTADFAGLWRYRIGDDRLVYQPNTDSKKIVLLSYGPRGSAYEQ